MFISDPATLKAILSDMDLFPTPTQVKRVFALIVGETALPVSEGVKHRELRKLWNPMFSAQAVQDMEGSLRTHAKKVF